MNTEYKFELVEKSRKRETVIGRYASRERAEGEKNLRLQMYGKMRLSHGELIVRAAEENPCKHK